jgi:hypothetical protein
VLADYIVDLPRSRDNELFRALLDFSLKHGFDIAVYALPPGSSELKPKMIRHDLAISGHRGFRKRGFYFYVYETSFNVVSASTEAEIIGDLEKHIRAVPETTMTRQPPRPVTILTPPRP